MALEKEAGDLLGFDAGQVPGVDEVSQGQEAIGNFFKNIVGTKQALAEPPVTGFSDPTYEKPIWTTEGGTEIVIDEKSYVVFILKDGERQAIMPDGEYKLTNGSTLVVVDSKAKEGTFESTN